MTDDKRRVHYIARVFSDPLENLLGWAWPDQNATVEGRWLFVPDEYLTTPGYTDGIFIVNEDTPEFLD